MVTAPVQKSVINDAGIPFTGHTEYLAQRTAARLPVMMLAAGQLRVALATTHLPLARVCESLSIGGLVDIITVLDAELRRRFALGRPRILVCGLNPHAGGAAIWVWSTSSPPPLRWRGRESMHRVGAGRHSVHAVARPRRCRAAMYHSQVYRLVADFRSAVTSRWSRSYELRRSRHSARRRQRLTPEAVGRRATLIIRTDPLRE
jgi:hypothetical protein